jgi:signal transduction histidine kinase
MDKIAVSAKTDEQPCILVVEDDPGLNRLICIKIERMGINVCGVKNGADCITTVLQTTFDLLLLDYRLPDMNCSEVIEKLEQQGVSVPFIVATGNGDQRTAVEMMKAGARHYMVKDPDFIELLPGIIELTLKELHAEKVEREAKKSLEEQLRQAQKMESIGVLAGGVAHDFNNLLTVILGFSEFALYDLAPGTKPYDNLLHVQHAAERATGLTRQLLLFSRSQEPSLVCIDVKKTLTEILKMIQRLIGEDIAIATDFTDAPCYILADIGNIEQVIMNLAVNARDAMPGGGKLTFAVARVALDEPECCTIYGSRPGEYVSITVGDTGSGIDDTTLQNIFDPFFTTKEEGKGTGLGLSVIYGIVNQHQGWINVQSKIGYGTEFTIFIPLSVDAAAERKIEEDIIADLKGQGQKVLVVEDDVAIREWCMVALEEGGYTVVLAGNAAEGIAEFKKAADETALVISDIVMPDRSGFDLAQQITILKPHTPIILMSGYPGDHSGYGRINETGYLFLQKPFTMVQLLQTVMQALTYELSPST